MKIEDMKDKLLKMQEEDYSSFVKALISIELGIDEKEKLNRMYTEFINSDDWYLINDNFYDYQ